MSTQRGSQLMTYQQKIFWKFLRIKLYLVQKRGSQFFYSFEFGCKRECFFFARNLYDDFAFRSEKIVWKFLRIKLYLVQKRGSHFFYSFEFGCKRECFFFARNLYDDFAFCNGIRLGNLRPACQLLNQRFIIAAVKRKFCNGQMGIEPNPALVQFLLKTTHHTQHHHERPDTQGNSTQSHHCQKRRKTLSA